MNEQTNQPLVEVEHLNVDFMVKRDCIHVLNDVSFHIDEGEVLAVIGETGCGKSVTGNALLRLLPENALCEGSIRWQGRELLDFDEEEFRRMRGTEIMNIAQNPVTALDPLMRVGRQVEECLTHRFDPVRTDGTTLRRWIVDVFKGLGLRGDDGRYSAYSCELSGGMCQRVLLAMGIVAHPRLLVADEPTKAIDWVLRKDVVETLSALNREKGVAMLVITHDIPFARMAADRVMVMYAGEVVESGPAGAVLSAPRHPYTKGLLDAQPDRGFKAMEGSMPAFSDAIKGCRFAARCPYATDSCAVHPELSAGKDGHAVRCVHPLASFEEAR